MALIKLRTQFGLLSGLKIVYLVFCIDLVNPYYDVALFFPFSAQFFMKNVRQLGIKKKCAKE